MAPDYRLINPVGSINAEQQEASNKSLKMKFHSSSR